MKNIKVNEKVIFLFLIILKPDCGDLFFSKSFFEKFSFLDMSNYEKELTKLINNGVLRIANSKDEIIIVTEFGSLLANLDFAKIKACGTDREKSYLKHLVKIGVFSHLPRK